MLVSLFVCLYVSFSLLAKYILLCRLADNNPGVGVHGLNQLFHILLRDADAAGGAGIVGLGVAVEEDGGTFAGDAVLVVVEGQAVMIADALAAHVLAGVPVSGRLGYVDQLVVVGAVGIVYPEIRFLNLVIGKNASRVFFGAEGHGETVSSVGGLSIALLFVVGSAVAAVDAWDLE